MHIKCFLLFALFLGTVSVTLGRNFLSVSDCTGREEYVIGPANDAAPRWSALLSLQSRGPTKEALSSILPVRDAPPAPAQSQQLGFQAAQAVHQPLRQPPVTLQPALQARSVMQPQPRQSAVLSSSCCVPSFCRRWTTRAARMTALRRRSSRDAK